MNVKPYQLLVIEDNIADVELVKLLFNQCDALIEFTFVHDGGDATDALFKRDKFESTPTPDLILMDLNVPRKDGREILKEIKQDEELRKIPVIVISTSSSRREIEEAYSLGASAFISKPPDLAMYERVVKSLVEFWLKSVELPMRAGIRI